MSSLDDKDTQLKDENLTQNSEEYSPSKAKRMRLDDGCNNNNINGTPDNAGSSDNGQWTCAGDTSLVEPEVLVDLGVSMLADETSCESLKILQTNDCNVSPTSRATTLDNVNNEKNRIDRIYHDSNFEKNPRDRLADDENNLNIDDPSAVLNDYSSHIVDDGFGKENNKNDDNLNSSLDRFCLFRRKKRDSIVGDDRFNKLSDEMILMILKWLPKKCLVRSMIVCKRWCQIARDEALWTRLDLGNKVLNKGTLGHILPRGVQILRLAQAEISDPLFLPGCDGLIDSYKSKLQYLDLSMAVISADGLTQLLKKCKLLRNLSLEKCILNQDSCKAISKNQDITILNLTMCEGIDEKSINYLVKLKSLNALNVAWCSLDSGSIGKLCNSLPQSVTRLNISGCRKTLTDTMVKSLVTSCPKLVELDLSDGAIITSNASNSIMTLKHLEHLSLSRCYSISPATFIRLAFMPSLKFLDLFGALKEDNLQLLKTTCNGTDINKYSYSSVARPTIGLRRTSIWGLRVRD